MLYGAIKKLSRNNKYFYSGYSDDFSSMTPEGESHVMALLNKIIPLMHKAESKTITDRAKEIVYGTLRDEDEDDIDTDEDEK